MADHDDGSPDSCSAGSSAHVFDHRKATYRMKTFRKVGLHARTFPRCKNDAGDGCLMRHGSNRHDTPSSDSSGRLARMPLCIVDHPLAQHLLTELRDQRTEPERFRQVTRVLSTILILEATKSLPLKAVSVETPLESMQASALDQPLAVVPVLRAGLAMLEPALALFPDVAVGYIGLERSHETAIAHSYYMKLPKLDGRFTLCVDPMLATGGSASQALTFLRVNGARELAMVSVISAPEGVERLQKDHPDVHIFTAGLDRELNSKKYILPGLGDFGDRLYGTL